MQDYWKLLNCSNYTALQNSFMLYLMDKNLVHKQEQDLVELLDANECLEAVGPLKQFLEENGARELLHINMTRHRRTFDQDLRGRFVKVSERNRGARVEIPLTGGDWSWHVFCTGRVKGWCQQKNGMGFWEYHDDSAIEVARVKITRPMVINSAFPHKIEFERQFLDRISITLLTEPEARLLPLGRSI